MTLLYPIGSLYPAQSGGPSNTIYWMGKALTQKQEKVFLVTTNKDIPQNSVELDKWLQTEFGEVRYCSTRFHYLPISMIYHSWKALSKVDVVHLTALYYPPSLLIAFLASISAKPIVWSVRGELHPAALQFSRFKKKVFLSLIALLPKRKIAFHATSPEETELIRKQFGENTNVIELPNFIELPTIVTPTTNNLYLLYVGRIHPIKGLNNLIEALALSKEFRQSTYTFQIAGNGDQTYIDNLLKRVNELALSEKIKFVGNVTGENKQALYAGAQFTFLVSQSENFGNVVVESLAQSTPVVASKGTPWKILEESKSGFWIDNDPVSIATTIDKILGMQMEEYLEMRKNALALATSQFDMKSNVYKWVNVYKEVVNA